MRYGWLPDEVDGLRARLADRLPIVAAIKDEIIAEERKREAKG